METKIYTNFQICISVPLTYKRILGIYGNNYRLIHSFLSDIHQRVVLNGQSSKWSHIKVSLHLVYINDLPEVLTTSTKLFCR